MNEPAALPTVSVAVKTVDPDTIFATLGDPTRRRLLLALSNGKPHAARTLGASSGKRFDATLKHLVALREAGLVVVTPDPADGRRLVYTLAACVKVETTPSGRTMDFGYCVVRI